MYFNKDNSFMHGIMFHHFHDGKLHKKGQGSIDIDQFKKIITYIGKENIINADDFLKNIKKNKNTKKVCLTFDDGLKCVKDVILPFLNELDIKCFFFVPSIIFENQTDHLEIYRYFRVNYFKDINDFYNSFFTNCKKDNLYSFLKKNEQRIKKTKEIYSFYSIKDIEFRLVRNEFLSIEEYQSIMRKMFFEKNFNPKNVRKLVFFNQEDLLQLKKENHTIGLHSHSHPNQIQKLEKTQQFKEYRENITRLSNLLGINTGDINSMSHPSGNYSEETLKILNDLGIKLGFRDNMFIEKGMKSINNSLLEISRSNHAEILRMV